MAKTFLLLAIIATAYITGPCNAWEVVNSVSNGYKHVTASTNYLWSVRGRNAYRCARPCTGSWVKDSGQLMQVYIYIYT